MTEVAAETPAQLETRALLEKQRLKNLTDQLEEYRERSTHFAKESAKLKSALKKNDLKTTEMVAYLRNEVQKRDLELKQLKKELFKKKDQLENADATSDDKVQAEREKWTKELEETRSTMRQQISDLKQEVEGLHYFKEHKQEIETTLLAARTTIEQQAKRFKSAVDNLEHKFLLDTERIRKECSEELKEVRLKAREEAERAMDLGSQQLRIDNQKMKDDITFHGKTTEELEKDNKVLRDKLRQVKIDLELNSANDNELARRSVKQQKRIKLLKGKNEKLEASLSKAIVEIDKDRDEFERRHQMELQLVSAEAQGAKAAADAWETEADDIRNLTQTVLDQRGETEQFFLQALQEVKDEVAQRQEEEYKEQLKAYTRATRQIEFATGEVKLPPKPTRGGVVPRKPQKPSGKIQLDELSLEERERVLRYLFAKINAGSKYPSEAKEAATTMPGEQEQGDDTFLTTQQFD